MLNSETVDLLEISGGTYEQPKLLGHTGSADTAVAEEPQRESTKQREAYFLHYARAIRQIATMPLMVTGGFRSIEVMEDALKEGICDVIGLGRPLCSHPNTPKDLLSGQSNRAVSFEHELVLANSGIFSPTSSVLPLKLLNVLGGQAWYYQQIFRLADGLPPDTTMGILKAFGAYYWDEITTARRVKKAAKR
jgi:hypothetical protein